MQNPDNRTVCIPLAETGGERHADLTRVLLQYLNAAPESDLPLQSACRYGGWADGSEREISLVDSRSDDNRMTLFVTIYFSEIVGGCNCNDDPVSHPALAQLRLVTHLPDGETTITIVDSDGENA